MIVKNISDSDKALDIYSKIPSSSEYMPRKGTEPRTLDLRQLDEMAKRGAFDDINKPRDTPHVSEEIHATQNVSPSPIVRRGIIESIKRLLGFKK